MKRIGKRQDHPQRDRRPRRLSGQFRQAVAGNDEKQCREGRQVLHVVRVPVSHETDERYARNEQAWLAHGGDHQSTSEKQQNESDDRL